MCFFACSGVFNERGAFMGRVICGPETPRFAREVAQHVNIILRVQRRSPATSKFHLFALPSTAYPLVIQH